MRRLLCLLVLLVLGLLLPVGVRAQQEADPRLVRSQALFAEAETHYRARRFQLAAETFQQVHALMVELEHPSAGMILFNIGRTLEELPGREVEARDYYQRFLLEADGADAAIQAQLHEVQERIRELDGRIAARPAAPDVGRGPEPPPDPEVERGSSPIGIGLTVAGGALLLVGAITGATALAWAEQVGASCTGGVCLRSARSLANDAEILSYLTDGLLVAGGLTAVIGAILWAVLPGEPVERAPTASLSCESTGCTLHVRGSL